MENSKAAVDVYKRQILHVKAPLASAVAGFDITFSAFTVFQSEREISISRCNIDVNFCIFYFT